MNSTSPSLLAKALVAALSLAVTAAVPLLTVQYAVRAHAEMKAPELSAAATHCPKACPTEKTACEKDAKKPCGSSGCATGRCAKS